MLSRYRLNSALAGKVGGYEMKKKKPAVTLPGRVEKVIPANYEPEKAQISVDGADPLYNEIRVENTLQDQEGKQVKLKPGDQVDVTIEGDPDATIPKASGSESDEDLETATGTGKQ
jgi:hypothetical protein